MPNTRRGALGLLANRSSKFCLIVLRRCGYLLARGSALTDYTNGINRRIGIKFVAVRRNQALISQLVGLIISHMNDAYWGTRRISGYHELCTANRPSRQFCNEEISWFSR